MQRLPSGTTSQVLISQILLRNGMYGIHTSAHDMLRALQALYISCKKATLLQFSIVILKRAATGRVLTTIDALILTFIFVRTN